MAKIIDDATPFFNSLSLTFGFETELFDSSAIVSGFYNQHTKQLGIRFKSGNLYGYSDVEESVWRGFADAESQGKYFNDHIRGRYDFEVLDKA